MNRYQKESKQLSLIKEEVCKQQPAKRVNIVSVKLVKKSSLLYKERSIHHQKMGISS